jgi:hypothetical protein
MGDEITNELPLELRLTFDDEREEFVVKEGEKEFVYVAEAKSIYFDGLDIMGQAILSKYERQHKVKSKRKVQTWLPLKIEVEKVPYHQDILVWDINKETYSGNKDFFIGSPKKDEGYSLPYRTRLNKNAEEKQKIRLSDQLLDKTFSKIDEKLKARYELAQRFQGSSLNHKE